MKRNNMIKSNFKEKNMKNKQQEIYENTKKEYENIFFEKMFQGCIKEVNVEDNVVRAILKDCENVEEDLLIEIDADKFPEDKLYPKLEYGIIFYVFLGQNKSNQEDELIIKYSQEVWTKEMIKQTNKYAHWLK